jgi:hypothetical protein
MITGGPLASSIFGDFFVCTSRTGYGAGPGPRVPVSVLDPVDGSLQLPGGGEQPEGCEPPAARLAAQRWV